MSENNSNIAILVPCYNEERTVGKVVDDFRAALPDATVYVFDNNSTDNTAAIATEHGAVVKRVQQKGKGNVVRAMFSSVETDVYVMVDGDDTYPADQVKELIAPIVEGQADMVVGDRLSSTYAQENKRLFHNSGNQLIRGLINRLFGVNLTDILSGYRAFSREFVSNMPVMSSGFEIETELTVFAIDNNYLVKEVPIIYRDRPDGSESKLNTFSDGLRVIKTLLMLFRDCRPVSFFSSISVLLTLASVTLLTPVFIDYFHTGLVLRFPTLIFGCFLLLGALMLFCVGVVIRVVNNQNRRMTAIFTQKSKH